MGLLDHRYSDDCRNIDSCEISLYEILTNSLSHFYT
jgi:hypothetical protein